MACELLNRSHTRRRVLLGATAIAANALTAACGSGSSATDTPQPVPPTTAAIPIPTTSVPAVTATPLPSTIVPTAAATASISVPPVPETFATPTGTPTTPLIVFTGASNVYGARVQRTETFPAQTIALLAPATYDAVNLGINGSTLSQWNDLAAAKIDLLYAASRSKNIIVMYAGPNDLYYGASVEESVAQIVKFGQARRRVGFKVVVCTFLPWSKDNWRSGEDFEIERQGVNALMRKNLASFADALADIGADPTIGAMDATANRDYYYSDGLHLVGKGYSIIAGIVKAAILTL